MNVHKEFNLYKIKEKNSDFVLCYYIYSHIFFGRISSVKNESENRVKEMSDKAQDLETQ